MCGGAVDGCRQLDSTPTPAGVVRGSRGVVVRTKSEVGEIYVGQDVHLVVPRIAHEGGVGVGQAVLARPRVVRGIMNLACKPAHPLVTHWIGRQADERKGTPEASVRTLRAACPALLDVHRIVDVRIRPGGKGAGSAREAAVKRSAGGTEPAEDGKLPVNLLPGHFDRRDLGMLHKRLERVPPCRHRQVVTRHCAR